MVSEITRFYYKSDMMSSLVLRLAAFHTVFVDGIWKSTPSFISMVHWHISRISYRFEVIRHFILTYFRGVFRVKHPKFHNYNLSSYKMSSLHQTASVELLWAKIGSRVWAVALLKNTKKRSHRTRICCPHVVTRPLIGSEPNLAVLVISLT